MLKTKIMVGFTVITVLTAIIALAVQWSVEHPQISKDRIKNTYQEKSDQIKDTVLPAITETDYYIDSIEGYVVIMSSANEHFRATTKVGTGSTIKSAWQMADNQMKIALENSSYEPKWVKCDIINHTEQTTESKINATIYGEDLQAGTFHYGISMDEKFTSAVLEQEMNAIRAYDYKVGKLDNEQLWTYIYAARNMIGEETDPTLFQCDMWLCEENGDVIKLQTDNLNYGRRELDPVDINTINYTIENAGEYIKNERDGSKFTYLYYPQHDQVEDDYNVVRHAGALWGLTEVYETTHDPAIKGIIEKGVKYIEERTTFKDDAAYIATEDDDKFNAGASGLSLIALAKYQQTYNDNRFEKLANAIAKGILDTQDPTTGQFIHSLNQDLTTDEEYVIVYYDGETILGLTELYKVTGNEEYLETAEKGLQYMIDNDYYTYADHWIAYSVNELTKLYPDRSEYYAFMFKNLESIIKTYKNRTMPNPTALEGLINSFECYVRAKENGIEIPDTFSEQELVGLIYKRMDRQMSNFFFPEKAMYTTNPGRILNTFYNDNTTEQRIRIDDVQHNIGGLYLCAKLHDMLVEHGIYDTKS